MYADYYGVDKEQYFKMIQGLIEEEAKSMYATHKKTIEYNLKLADYENYIEMSTSRNVAIVYENSESAKVVQTIALSEAVVKFTAALFKVSSMNSSVNILEDKIYKFIVNNGLSSISAGLLKSFDSYFVVAFPPNS
eukprot:TRINITY_DN6661_c0_g1_i1.p2 TRINITY_DN6661_c0_g1~~TRINITY_DN6661_c0_g1_i1.p2  ORF type:complete len:136 (+),score=14.81 TRINITY_DN6661_c0_g1_i1:883-1290(+)